MDYIVKGYKPEKLFNFFEEICRIPHGSGNEEQIADYLENYAKNKKLFYRRDKNNNLFIKKNATEGYENKEPILLQGHMDMVCEKNNDTVHDFLKDPLDLYVEKGFLKARGTTLGGDDGIAVAMILAVLDSDDLKHPALECLITTEEETGMTGANEFDCSDVKATRILNLDSENEGEAIVGCAGGARVLLRTEYDRIVPQNKSIKIDITGLSGGHSGEEINLPKKNSIMMMGRLLSLIYEKSPFNLISVIGGNKNNAIPRECSAVISTCEPEAVYEICKTAEKEFKAELSEYDKKFKLHVGRAKICKEPMLTFKDTGRIINTLVLTPNGVNTYSPVIPGFVESSDNLGILRVEGNSATLNYLCRSSTESLLDDIINKIKTLAKLTGFECLVNERYNAWEVVPNSPLQEVYKKAVIKVYDGKIEPKLSLIHAGLECGVLKEKINHETDIIAFGPNIYDIHSPRESLELASCERVWKLLVYLLENC